MKTIETQTATRFDKERHGRKTVFSVFKNQGLIALAKIQAL